MSNLDNTITVESESEDNKSIDAREIADRLASINTDLARIKELVRERETRFRRPIAHLARIVRN